MLNQARQDKTDFIFTTGGTGIGPKDFTPEVVKPMLDKEIPGIMELIRTKYGAEKPNALASRSIAGVMNESLVFTLPGSVKAVNEYMTEISPTIHHMVFMLHGIDRH
jgi:molybdenum cofactor synthesis domain-containing protein